MDFKGKVTTEKDIVRTICKIVWYWLPYVLLSLSLGRFIDGFWQGFVTFIVLMIAMDWIKDTAEEPPSDSG